MIRTVLFLLLLAVPIAEIAVFLTVGGQIGVLPTLLIIVLTALLGAILLKRQGSAALAALQSDMRQGRVPAAAIGHAITVAIAGALLLTPGFITDAVGFLLFIPAVRGALWRQMASSVRVDRTGPQQGPSRGPTGPTPGGGRVIDLEAQEVPPRDPNSPWTDGSR